MLQVFIGSSPSIWVGEPDEATDSTKRLILDEIDILCSRFDVCLTLHLILYLCLCSGLMLTGNKVNNA